MLDSDGLVAAVRLALKDVNFPTCADLGLETDDCEGRMLVQFYAKPGTGSPEENLAQKPYACYDLETDEWLVEPKRITPRFYADGFRAVMTAAEDIAVQAEAAISELQRWVTNWQFWSAFGEGGARETRRSERQAAEWKDAVHQLFLGVFEGRKEAYSETGKGIEDERDLIQKLLEVWGIFQELKHFARAKLPWEEGYEKESGWRLAAMERLGASVDDLAKETIEEILGYQGEKGTGHRPPRADIAKLKEAYDLFQEAHVAPKGWEEADEGQDVTNAQAQQEWGERYGLNEREIAAVERYRRELNVQPHRPDGRGDPKESFDRTVSWMVRDFGFVGHEEDARAFLGKALKKYEGQNSPGLYEAISNGLDDLYRMNTASYKLWPWFVKQVKDQHQERLANPNTAFTYNPVNIAQSRGSHDHLKDVTSEAGALLSKLRAENKTPQGMDVNRMDGGELEDWLMGWKRENRASEAQGQVVYEFHDGFTVQRLTTPEQLQYEGDEMGHCVGGYHSQVDDGSTIIYSLRDKTGKPHVTIEVNALEGGRELGEGEEPSGPDPSRYEFPHHEDREDYEYWNRLQNEGRLDLARQHFPGRAHEKVLLSPEQAAGGADDLWAMHSAMHGKLKPEFEVIQVQGNSNQTPKREYQAKIKEWMDAMREKGVEFFRSDDWFANYDADEPESVEYPDIGSASKLDDWHDWYRGGGYGQHRGGPDEYGMVRGDTRIQDLDLQEVMEECAASLVEDGDRDRWKSSDWQGLADATLHAAAEAAFDQSQFDLYREKAEETLQGWVDQAVDQYEDADAGTMRDKVREKAEALGIDLDEEQNGTYWNYWDAVEAHPELEEAVQEIRDEMRDETEKWYAGDAHKYFQRLYDLANTTGSYESFGTPGQTRDWAFPSDPPEPGSLPLHMDFERMRGGARRDWAEQAIPGALSSARSPAPRAGREAPSRSPRLPMPRQADPSGWAAAGPAPTRTPLAREAR